MIASQNAKMRVEPASLTKIMTAYLSFKALKNGHLQLSQTLPVSEKAWKIEGSKMFIEPNKPVTVDELLHGMIVVSGNDASIALAEGIASSEEFFADMMNKEAQRLGMKNTHFANATGLPNPQHYSTAEDLAILANALIRDFPQEYHRLYSIKEYTYPVPPNLEDTPVCEKTRAIEKSACYKNETAFQPNVCKAARVAVSDACAKGGAGITQPNRNRLLWLDPYVDGMKTGHTESAGYCLISSAKRDNTRRISVVLGAPNDAARATESQKLLNYSFQFFDSTQVYKKGQPVNRLKVWKGSENLLSSTVADDVYLTLPKGAYANVKAVISSTQPLIAPIKKGQAVGTVKFMLDGKVIGQHTLVAAKTVETAGILGRAWDSIKLLLQ
ncbi:MAG: D-alanyl-D-alanine carboxypeptidase family protein [Methylotenera sp.]